MQSYPSRRNQTVTLSQPLASNYRIKVKAGDNWLLPGRKGSGKTTFAKYLFFDHLAQLYPHSRLYVLDIKRRDFEDYPGIIQTDYAAPPRPDKNQRLQIWQPLDEEPESIEEWLYNILHDAPSLLLIDELLALCYGRKHTSDQYKRIQKLGRGLPIGTISATQELVEIPRNAIGQQDHIARFRLKHPYELSMMDQIMGVHKPEIVDKYGFLYQHADSGAEPIYYRDAQTFFGIPH